MKFIIEYIPWFVVTMPAVLALTEVLGVELLPALGVVFWVSATTIVASAFRRGMEEAGF